MQTPDQRSDDWRQQRAGKLTASRFVDVIARTRDGKPTAARAKYLREIVFERLAGIAKHEVSSKSMAWGTDVEPFQREAFELETGMVVRESGFVLHPVYPFIGASPDGLIDPDGGLEMKSPHDEAVHIQTLLEGMPDEHMAQVQGNMAVTGRSWWYFTSYDPRQAPGLRLFHQRIERNEKFIACLIAELRGFHEEAEAMVEQLRRRAA